MSGQRIVDLDRLAVDDDGALRREARRVAETLAVGVARAAISPRRLEVGLACRLLVVAPSARLAGPGGEVPVIPGTLDRLVSRLGPGGALAFWLGRRAWDAESAREHGLIDEIADDPAGRAAAIVALWEESGPAACLLGELVGRAGRLSPRAAVALERASFAYAFAGERARAGARRFIEGR